MTGAGQPRPVLLLDPDDTLVPDQQVVRRAIADTLAGLGLPHSGTDAVLQAAREAGRPTRRGATRRWPS